MALANLRFIRKRTELYDKPNHEDVGEEKPETWRLLSKCEKFYFSPRSKHTMVAYKGMIYIFGGDRGNIMLNDLFKYDVVSHVWEAVQTNEAPTPRYHHSAVVYGDSMFVFGGYTGDIHSNINLTNKNDLYEFKFETNQWELWQVQGKSPVARSAHSAVVYDKKMWVFAGYDGNVRLNDMWTIPLDSGPRTWARVEQVGDCPPTCCNFPVAIVQDSMFVFSGQSGAKITNSLYQFHFKSLTWQRITMDHIMRKVPSPPTRRFGHSMVSYGNNLFVFGGAADGMLPNDLHCYNMDTFTWSTIRPAEGSDIPSGRLFHSATMVDDCMYVFGGTVDNNIRTGELYRFQLVCYPKCTLHEDFEALLEKKEFCDMEFIVGPDERKFPAHIALITARSKYLASKIDGVRSQQKDSQKFIQLILPCVHPETLQMMLYYIYTDKVDPRKVIKDFTPKKCVTSVLDLYKLALDFDLKSLEQFCTYYLKNAINHSNVLYALHHASCLKLEFVKSYCFKFLVKDSKFSQIVMREEFGALDKSIIVEIIRRRQVPAMFPINELDYDDMTQTTSLEEDMKKFLEGRGRKYVDITLKLDNIHIPAHKAILAARCTYFQAMFRSFMPEDRTVNVKIDNITPSQTSFNSLLKYIYSGEVDVSPEESLYLFSAPFFFGFTNNRFNVFCKRSLELSVGPEHLVLLLEAAHNLGANDMKRYALRVVVQNFVNVACLPRFKMLEKDLLLEIMDVIAEEMVQPSPAHLRVEGFRGNTEQHNVDVIVRVIR